jgi:hypothetical protein
MESQMSGLLQRHGVVGNELVDGAMDPIVEINLQCLELLRRMATAGTPRMSGLCGALLAPLKMMSEPARTQLAASPYLLVDAGFNDPQRWQSFAQGAVRDQLPGASAPVFVGDNVREFARKVLVCGWHMARSHRQLARVVLGMSPACAVHVAALRLHDIDWLVEHRAGWVRPRWESQPRIWRHLLLAAQEPDSRVLTQVSLRGLQLLAANLLTEKSVVPAL